MPRSSPAGRSCGAPRPHLGARLPRVLALPADIVLQGYEVVGQHGAALLALIKVGEARGELRPNAAGGLHGVGELGRMGGERKSKRLNSSNKCAHRMPSSA